MSRYTDSLVIGRTYDRKTLANLWDLGGYQALGRGVFTPRGTRLIFLFVTRQRETWMTDYENDFDGEELIWDGEKGHGNDDRIANAKANGDEIHLFYRDTRAMPFTYHGELALLHCLRSTTEPSKFAFHTIESLTEHPTFESAFLAEDSHSYATFSESGLNAINRPVTAKSRGFAQRFFRRNLLHLWRGSCAVTGVRETRVLRSSHIKPWVDSDPREKVDHFNGLLLVPNLDALFNEGLISFRNNGRILISDDWNADDKRRMQIMPDLKLAAVHPESQAYLEFHRDMKFKGGHS